METHNYNITIPYEKFSSIREHFFFHMGPPPFLLLRRGHKKYKTEALNSRYWIHFSYCAKEKVIR